MRIGALLLLLCLALETSGQINAARRQYPARYVPQIETRILPRLCCEDTKIAQNVIAWQWQTIAQQGATIQNFAHLTKPTKIIVIFKNPIADLVAKILIAGALHWTITQIK